MLAAMFGLYFVAAGIMVLGNTARVNTMLKDMIQQPLFGFLGGLIAFVVGGVILGVHNNWNGFLPGLITLFGWIALVEGLLLIALPNWFLGMFANMNLSQAVLKFLGAVTILAGMAVLALGYYS